MTAPADDRIVMRHLYFSEVERIGASSVFAASFKDVHQPGEPEYALTVTTRTPRDKEEYYELRALLSELTMGCTVERSSANGAEDEREDDPEYPLEFDVDDPGTRLLLEPDLLEIWGRKPAEPDRPATADRPATVEADPMTFVVRAGVQPAGLPPGKTDTWHVKGSSAQTGTVHVTKERAIFSRSDTDHQTVDVGHPGSYTAKALYVKGNGQPKRNCVYKMSLAFEWKAQI
jgi:hypothetical protein